MLKFYRVRQRNSWKHPGQRFLPFFRYACWEKPECPSFRHPLSFLKSIPSPYDRECLCKRSMHCSVKRVRVKEISYKQGYVGVIFDLDRNRTIWVEQNPGLGVLEEFAHQLTEEERARIEVVAGDEASWIDSCMPYFPNAKHCADFSQPEEWVLEMLNRDRQAPSA